jgi:hypothetical protein
MKTYLLLLGLCTSIELPAQGFEWAKQIGGAAFDYSSGIVVDQAGNVYSAGYFSGTADMDGGASTFTFSSSGSSDIFISKSDVNGNFLWAKQIGGTGKDQLSALALDASGNIYVTGSFQGTVDFDPGPNTINRTSFGGDDIFIAKLDPNGNVVWSRQMGGIDTEYPSSICVSPSGSIYTCGWFRGTADFDPSANTTNLTSNGGDDAFIAKLDANGVFAWAKQIGGGDMDYGFSIKVDAAENIYVTGSFIDEVDFDPGSGIFKAISKGMDDIFISKWDGSGAFIWTYCMGSSDSDSGYGITVDTWGNIYTTGWFQGTVDFDPGVDTTELSSKGVNDLFVSKLNKEGKLVWAKQFGGSTYDEGFAIAADDYDNVYITGAFQGTVDFDPGVGKQELSSNGADDVFIMKLDWQGNLALVKQLGNAGNDEGLAIAVDASGNIYIAGIFKGIVDFNTETGVYNLTAVGDADIFVHKLGLFPLALEEENAANTISLCPNPASTSFTLNNLPLKGQLKIHDLSGKLIYLQQLNTTSLQLSTDILSNGVYLVQIVGESNVVSTKLVVNK